MQAFMSYIYSLLDWVEICQIYIPRRLELLKTHHCELPVAFFQGALSNQFCYTPLIFGFCFAKKAVALFQGALGSNFGLGGAFDCQSVLLYPVDIWPLIVQSVLLHPVDIWPFILLRKEVAFVQEYQDQILALEGAFDCQSVLLYLVDFWLVPVKTWIRNMYAVSQEILI